MTREEMKNKYAVRAKIFQQAMESCKSSSPMDCIEWFADRITDLEKENAELKEKLAGAERTRDNLIQLGFPTFQSCKEYADKMNFAKSIIKGLLDNTDEYARQKAEDFFEGE